MSRYAFVVFVLISVAGLAMAVQCFVDPLGFFAATQAVSGVDFAALAARDAQAHEGLMFLGRWIGTVLLGSDGITLVLAVTLFRRGDDWARRVLWYWPVMFALHALLYRPGTTLFYVQFVNLALSTAALVAARRGRTGRPSPQPA